MIFVLNKLFSGALNVHRFSKLVFLSKSALLAVAFSILTQAYGAPSPFLSTSGQNIRNNYGQGDIVPLRGVNLGSWLLMEGWMCPMDSSGLADNYTVVQTLNNRFGVATQESLLKTYQDAWITTNDLDNIKALGMNCVRMPFWWGNVQRLDGSWRADAFEKMDWLVTNAWQRGIYTIIDFHGVPGGQSASDSTAQANQNQYWTSAAFQNQTSLIWSNVAAHFNGNPAVAGYDLINEPFGAPTQAVLWSAYTNLYQTVRAVDPDHIIVMEGCWSGQGLNWEWNVLPSPTRYGWTNVVYSMHAYAGTTTASGEKAETDKQVNDFNNHQAWNVPCFIGEFNSHGTHSAWQYSVQQYDQNNMSWDNWAYKAIAGSVGNSWGIYDPTGTWPPKPNIQSDSISTISNDWSQWKTRTAFGVTSFLKQYLGAPLAIADFYTNSGTLIVNSNSGVLANDQDINLGLSGISLSAVLVGNPANGQLTLNTNGSFTYTPNGGFNGIDTFRYRVFDGYVNSANIATVSIQVYPLVSQTNAVLNMTDNKNGTFTLNFLGTVGVTYCIQTATNLTPPVYWLALAGSTNTVTNSSGLWSCTSTNSDSQRYYRSVVAYP
jgi:aryl-phospho-beta-D-glucosidase BglC (GH1 family)